MRDDTCKCADWCDATLAERQIRILTGHHADCRRDGSPLDAALALINRLAKGIEAWAADEDGVHPEVWESYRQAKALYGVYLPAEQPEEKS